MPYQVELTIYVADGVSVIGEDFLKGEKVAALLRRGKLAVHLSQEGDCEPPCPSCLNAVNNPLLDLAEECAQHKEE